jgi:hypothetical protein
MAALCVACCFNPFSSLAPGSPEDLHGCVAVVCRTARSRGLNIIGQVLGRPRVLY